MPIKVHFRQDGVGVAVIATGTPTGDRIIAAHPGTYRPRNLRRQRVKTVDRSACTGYRGSPSQVHQTAEPGRAAAQQSALAPVTGGMHG